MIRKILVPLDGSALSEGALPQAVAAAKAFDAEIVVLRVLETATRRAGALVDSVAWRLKRAEGASYVKATAAKLCARGARATGLLAEGDPAEEVMKLVREHAADLVVLTSHGRGGVNAFSVGSTAQKVLSQAGTSILLVRAAKLPEEAEEESRFLRIMVPLDGSQRAQWALLQAVSLARAHRGEILLVHVVTCPRLAGRTLPTPEETELARKMAERDRRVAAGYLREMEDLMTGSGVRARSLLLESPHVVQTLEKAAAAEQISLMVVSAHGCSGAAPWPYGSVADRLIHHGTTPILVLQDLTAQQPAEDVAARIETAALASA
jgi:nucleotide-binding universal stress UspA family protein